MCGTWQKEHFQWHKKVQAKLVLKLRSGGRSGGAISTSQGISRNSVADVLGGTDRLNIGWEDGAEKPENEVYASIFPGPDEHQSVFNQPDRALVHQQLARVGVTLKLLPGECLNAQTGPTQPVMGYDRLCKTYQRHVLETNVSSGGGAQGCDEHRS